MPVTLNQGGVPTHGSSQKRSKEGNEEGRTEARSEEVVLFRGLPKEGLQGPGRHASAGVSFSGPFSSLRRPATRRSPAEQVLGGSMARITIEDCIARVPNRFHLVQMAAVRTKQ